VRLIAIVDTGDVVKRAERLREVEEHLRFPIYAATTAVSRRSATA